jgi:predicted transcriptional regulator
MTRHVAPSIHSMFAELASETRSDILDELSKGEKRFTAIKRDLNLTSPELARQLQRLEDAYLVTKMRTGHYAISDFGMTIRLLVTNLEFVLEHSDYFRTHDPSVIPDSLFRQLDRNMETEFVTDRFGPISLVLERGASIREFYWIISDSIPRFALPQVKMKIRQGVRFKALYPREYLRGIRSTLEKEIIQSAEFRVADRVNIVVCVTDQFAYVCLPKFRDAEIDRGHFMFGSSPRFRTWCRELFHYYWNKSST